MHPTLEALPVIQYIVDNKEVDLNAAADYLIAETKNGNNDGNNSHFKQKDAIEWLLSEQIYNPHFHYKKIGIGWINNGEIISTTSSFPIPEGVFENGTVVELYQEDNPHPHVKPRLMIYDRKNRILAKQNLYKTCR